MSLSYEEKIKLENSKEHLQVVVKNIAVANKELNLILQKVKDAEVNLGNINSKIKSVIKEYDTTVSNTKQQITILNNKIGEADGKASRADALLSSARSESQIITTGIAEAQRNHEIVISNYQKTEREILLSIDKLTKEFSLIENKIQDEKESYEKAIQQRQSVEKEVYNLNCEKDNLASDLREIKRQFDFEMAETATQIEAEKEKIKRPLELLNESNAYVQREKSYVDQMRRRIQKYMKRIYPDLEF